MQVTFPNAGDDDVSPWEYPALEDLVRSKVLQGVRSSTTHAKVLRTAREFTILQRLFRVALDGYLGDRFPIERLVAPASKTSRSVPESRTLRWNPRPGLLEAQLAVELGSILGAMETSQPWERRGADRIRACKALIESATDPSSIPDSGWSLRCDLEDLIEASAQACRDGEGDETACLLELGAMRSAQASAARELRRALGVHQDDRLMGKHAKGCPAIGGLDG